MTIKEESIVMHRTDENGNPVLQFPYTKGENIETPVPITAGGTDATTVTEARKNLKINEDFYLGYKDDCIQTIPKESDLNDYKTAGTYLSMDTATSQTLLNTPYKNGHFKLVVFQNLANYGAQLIITARINAGMFVRYKNGSSTDWSEWTSFGKLGDSVPVGTITAYAGTDVPKGYVACDGAKVSRSTYASLFSVIGTTFGSGDGSTTFTLPNFTVNKIITGVSATVVGNGTSLQLTNGTEQVSLAQILLDSRTYGIGSIKQDTIAVGALGTDYYAGTAKMGYGVVTSGNSGLKANVTTSGVTVKYCIKY